MGTKVRSKPERLPEKLVQRRTALDLSQSEMHRRLAVEELISFKEISKYELGTREPTLIILLEYSSVAGVHMEVLADDALDLPKRLSGKS